MNAARHSLRCALEQLVLPGLVVLIWWCIAAAGWVPRIFLPSPLSVAKSLFESVASGAMTLPVGQTAWRMLVGWLLASVIGVALGSLVALNRTLHALIGPTLELLRPLPASAVIPVAILAMGLSNQMVITVVAFGSLWPVLLSTMAGFKAVDPRLREVSTSLEFTRWEFVTKFALRSAAPDIIAGLRLGVTLALILCVVSEMISMSGGIGAEILLASRNFRSAELYAGIVVIAAMGFALNRIILEIEKRILHWRMA